LMDIFLHKAKLNLGRREEGMECQVKFRSNSLLLRVSSIQLSPYDSSTWGSRESNSGPVSAEEAFSGIGMFSECSRSHYIEYQPQSSLRMTIII
jgi:hypothetical protein